MRVIIIIIEVCDTIKCIHSDLGHSTAEGYIPQLIAILESIKSNGSHIVGDDDFGQRRVIGKSRLTNRHYVTADGHVL